MSKGVDLNSVVTPALAACLSAHQYTFVCRYLKRTPACLTRLEAEVISHAGMSVVLVVEIGFPTTADHFSTAQGREDGAFAYEQAHALGAPAGAVVYYAVDFDAGPAALQGPISDYFAGISAAFETAGAGHPAYPIGVYGSGLTCLTLAHNTPVAYTWLAMARGWRHSRSYTGWNIRQNAGVHVCGVAVDEDESNGHAGGWRLT